MDYLNVERLSVDYLTVYHLVVDHLNGVNTHWII